MRDQFYRPGTWVSPLRPKVTISPSPPPTAIPVPAPPQIPGYCTLPLETILTITNNIQAAIKAHHDGQISVSQGDPIDFILKMTENLRLLAIRTTVR